MAKATHRGGGNSVAVGGIADIVRRPAPTEGVAPDPEEHL